MNWLRRLLGLHVHEWGGILTAELPGEIMRGQHGVVIQLCGRTFRWRECDCGAQKMIYGSEK